MNDNYELVYVYKYSNDFYTQELLITNNKVILNGKYEGKIVSDVFNKTESTSSIKDRDLLKVPFNTKRKGFYLSSPISMNDYNLVVSENENLYNCFYLTDYKVVDIDETDKGYILKPTRPNYTETEKNDIIKEFNSKVKHLYKLINNENISLEDKRIAIIGNSINKLDKLKSELYEVKDNIKMYGYNKENEQRIVSLKNEIKEEVKEINKLIKINKNN